MTMEILDHATKCSMNQNSTPEGIYRPKKRCTWTRSTNGTNLTKDTVKRQNSMKEDSGVKEQYLRTSIFERIYQHYTTREQTTFTLNHHHTTISDNSRLPENTPRPYIRVLPEQNNLDICLGATKGKRMSLRTLLQRQMTSRPEDKKN